MEITSRINNLIENLTDLKPQLSSDQEHNEQKFSNILSTALSQSQQLNDNSNQKHSMDSHIKSWSDPSKSLLVENGKKPNTREMMEILSGKSVEELYSDPNSNWQEISNEANEILYGVLGNKGDTRDWATIMNSTKILQTARIETKNMHQPIVDIVSVQNAKNELVDQYAVLKDSEGKILRALKGDKHMVEVTLNNFGASNDTIPLDINDKITYSKFNPGVLEILNKFKQASTDLESEENSVSETAMINTVIENYAAKLSNNIPLEELEKL